ncbi:globin domain-containing protein [Streptomyces sp. WAC06614]|uniref:globin domain-containing protein n=1 Tax=Streptomyces sp. WAC06614 TaxID=2487416 RepID=UPI0021AFEC17|nr:globin domain-containing protein [Streptomyces sp. WAC06614]
MDVKILKSSFAVAERRAEHTVKFFYAHLFRHHPALRELFPVEDEDMQRQRDRLFAALTRIVGRLHDDGLLPYLHDLGRDHRKYRVAPEHYAAVGTSLRAALAAACGASWTPATEKAWAEAYQVVADAMTDGAARSQDPPWWDAEVVRHLTYGPDTGVLTLLPDAPLPYVPGQYVSVSSDLVPRVWRPYSLGNAPRPDRTVDLHVSRIDGGRLSTALVRRTAPGDRLRLGAPGGRAVLRREGRPISFVAAGTGWAPVRAMLEDLAERPPDAEVRLFVVARDAAHFYDRPVIEALAAGPVRPSVTYITPAPGRHRNQATERLATALGNRGRWPDQDVHLSGPAPFVEEIAHLVRELGADPARVFHDALPYGAGTAGRPRPLGPGEWFLDPPAPHWHDPAARM